MFGFGHSALCLYESARNRMKILFVASLHHPEQLRAAREHDPDVLFPPSMSQHFWEKALRRRGHTLAVFWRNHPGSQTQRQTAGITPGKVINALINRVPPQLQPGRPRPQRRADRPGARLSA